MPLSDAKLAALKANLEMATKCFEAERDQYDRAIEAAALITSAKPARKKEKEGLLAQAEALTAAKENSAKQVEYHRQRYEEALRERQKEQEARTATLAAEQEAELAAQQEAAGVAAAAVAAAGSRGTQPNGNGAAAAGFFPSPAQLTSGEAKASITASVRCPYEAGCSTSVIPPDFIDSRIRPALNLLLLWLVREAAYRTVHEKYEAWGVSATYKDLDFNIILLAQRQKLDVTVGAAMAQDVLKIDQALQAFFGSLKGGDITQAFSDWLGLSRKLKAEFKDHSLYFHRLASAITEVFELFLSPTTNSRELAVDDLARASAETVLMHPVYTFKLRILHYIASLCLQTPEGELLGKEKFVVLLYNSLKSSVHTDAHTNDFAVLKNITDSLIIQFLGLRIQRDQGDGLVAAAVSFLKSAAKTATGVPIQGNFGVLLKCLKAEMDGEEMAERFRAHHDAAQATRTRGAPPSS